MTFDPHPSKIVRPDKAPPLLMTNQQKLDALARAGMHGVAIVRFTPELAQWDPETFVRTVLVEWLHVAEVWVGANFLFGHDRQGTFLDAAKPRRALRLSRREDRSCSLQGLRRQQHAHPAADHRRARRRGRRAARPSLRDRRHGREGAAAWARIWVSRRRTCARRTSSCRRAASTRRRRSSDGVAYPSITNIGTRPTFESGEEIVVETHVLGLRQGSVRRSRAAGFVQRLRDEKKFDGVEALKRRLTADRAHAHAICSIGWACRCGFTTR